MISDHSPTGADAAVPHDGWTTLYTFVRQQRRYHGEKAHPTGRNLGPRGTLFGLGRAHRMAVWVVIDRVIPAGATFAGRVLAEPLTILDYPLSRRLHSIGSGKKALRRARRLHPDAKLLRYEMDTRRALPQKPWRAERQPVFEVSSVVTTAESAQ